MKYYQIYYIPGDEEPILCKEGDEVYDEFIDDPSRKFVEISEDEYKNYSRP